MGSGCDHMCPQDEHETTYSGQVGRDGVGVSHSLNDYEVANMKSIQLINDNI